MASMKRFSFLLLGLSLAACSAPTVPAADETVRPAATPQAAASASPAGPVIRRSLPPPNYPSPQASTAASTPSDAPAATGTVTMTGTVYSDGALELYGAHVSVQSLDPKHPFSSRVTALKGRYTVEGVPASTQVRVTASLPGYEIRTQMFTTGTSSAPGANQVDFNGPYALPKTPS